MLPLALTTSGVLLLSSLSLQTLALHQHQRSRHALTTAQRRDDRQSLRADWLQRATGVQACLLALSLERWIDHRICPGADPQPLMAGRIAERSWQLIHWQPVVDGLAQLQIRWGDGSEERFVVELPR
mgnify:CR=1 FL=1